MFIIAHFVVLYRRPKEEARTSIGVGSEGRRHSAVIVVTRDKQ